MDLSSVTPMILTYNEEANIGRALDSLSWADEILLVDSFSTDATLAIAKRFSSVRVVQRVFDHFAEQCNFGLANIKTDWVLSLDADYICNPSFIEELSIVNDGADGYSSRFKYAVYGKVLRASLYPPRTVLYRRDKAKYVRDGHAHRVVVDGKVGSFKSFLTHDDRKHFDTWLLSQVKYAKHEAEKLTSKGKFDWKERIRRTILFAPVLTLFYCLFWKRLILDGWPGTFYSLQRVYAELLLSMELLDRKLSHSLNSVPEPIEQNK